MSETIFIAPVEGVCTYQSAAVTSQRSVAKVLQMLSAYKVHIMNHTDLRQSAMEVAIIF